MLKVLEGFHHWAYRRITGIKATHGAGRKLESPPMVAALEAAGLHPIKEYIRRRHVTIAEKLACRSIYELCVKAE